MNVRLFTMDDYDKVFRLWSGTPGIGMRSLDDSKEGIARFLARNPTTNFVAEQDGEVIGVTLAGHDGRRGYIYHTAVSNRYRGRRVGKALIDAAVQAMSDEKINKVALLVKTENESGIAFWEGCGFEERRDLLYMDITLNQDNV